MEKLTVVELTPESFRGYGSVLSVSPGTPMADSEEITYWGKVAELEMGPRVSTGYLSCKPRPGVLKQLERHLRTPEDPRRRAGGLPGLPGPGRPPQGARRSTACRPST